MTPFAYEPSPAELIALSRSIELKLDRISISDSFAFTDPETQLIKVSLFNMIKYAAYTSAYNQTVDQINEFESKYTNNLPAIAKGYRLSWSGFGLVAGVTVTVGLILTLYGQQANRFSWVLLSCFIGIVILMIYRDIRYGTNSGIDAELNKRHAHLELLTDALNRPTDINSSIVDLTVFKPYDPN